MASCEELKNPNQNNPFLTTFFSRVMDIVNSVVILGFLKKYLKKNWTLRRASENQSALINRCFIENYIQISIRSALCICTKMMFPIEDFCSRLPIWSNFLKKFLMKNFIFCAVCLYSLWPNNVMGYNNSLLYLLSFLEIKTSVVNEIISFSLIGRLNMEGWTATTRHGVIRKRSTKRLKNIENLFRKNLQLIGVC